MQFITNGLEKFSLNYKSSESCKNNRSDGSQFSLPQSLEEGDVVLLTFTDHMRDKLQHLTPNPHREVFIAQVKMKNYRSNILLTCLRVFAPTGEGDRGHEDRSIVSVQRGLKSVHILRPSAVDHDFTRVDEDVVIVPRHRMFKIEKALTWQIYLPVFHKIFDDAVSEMAKSKEIAVAPIGAKYSERCAKIELMAVSNGEKIFVINVHLMGKDVFLKGFKRILQNPNIKKIFHNAEFFSNVLKEDYETEIRCFVDTAILDKTYCEKMNVSDEEVRLKSLSECLKSHLHLPKKITQLFGNILASMDKIAEIPVSKEAQVYAALQVAFLFDLKNVLEKKIEHIT